MNVSTSSSRDFVNVLRPLQRSVEKWPGQARPSPILRLGVSRGDKPNHILPFLHSARNFLRASPCRPLASASFEHSADLAALSAGVIVVIVPAGAAGAAGAGAGAVV